jgi:predicted component of type VI protein secretion system
MDRGIRLETTSSYDENKYESLGVVSAAMSVTVSFTPPTPAKTSFFGTAPKPAPVDKQQKLTSTENQMVQALKKQLTMNAPPGTQRLIDFKISPPENIAHSPEYIISMLATATAIRKLDTSAGLAPAGAAGDNEINNSDFLGPLAEPPMSQPLAQPAQPPMSQPLAQLQAPLQQPAQMSQMPQMSQMSQMSKPLGNPFERQLGGKYRKRKSKYTKKKRAPRNTRKHHK